MSLDRYIVGGRSLTDASRDETGAQSGVADPLAAGIRRQLDVLRQMAEGSGPTYTLARERGITINAAYRDAGAPRRVARVRTPDGWAFHFRVRDDLGKWRIRPATEAEWLAWASWRRQRRHLRGGFATGDRG